MEKKSDSASAPEAVVRNAKMEIPVKILHALRKSKWFLVAAFFGLCAAPTFISYQPYPFEWDDSDYLAQSIQLSRAFWTRNLHGLQAVGGIRPPAMALLGIPWGPIASWDAAGYCFITLGAATALLAALCLYLMLRIGVKPIFLIAASVCVLAALGPYPQAAPFMSMTWMEKGAAAHFLATGFLADNLFAWTALAAVLLIPYELRTHCSSMGGAVLRGLLWASILGLGTMTKINFLYFVVLVVPILFFTRLYRGGLRNTLAAILAMGCCVAPLAFYLIRWGGPIFANLRDASFGRGAHFYYIPLLQFLEYTLRESPGMALSFAAIVAGLIYLVARKRISLWEPDLMAFLIMLGFGITALLATNKQIRYAFPAIVALPFLTAVLLSSKKDSAPTQFAALVAGLVFLGLLGASVPMRHRADRQSISRADAVLTQAAACKAQSITLATDSPTLNISLLELARQVAPSRAPVKISSLTTHAMNDVPIDQDFHAIGEADQVVFQDANTLSPPFQNVRVADYERYVRQREFVAARIADDVTIYSTGCNLR